MKKEPKRDETEHLLSTEANRNRLLCKDCNKSLEHCTCLEDTIDFPRQEIKLEEVFNDEKKENIKKFIDEINNPSEPNQALIDAAERHSNETLRDNSHVSFIAGAKWNQKQNDTSKVKRVEVIQHSPPYNGRAFTKYNAKDVEIQFQDDGRTLKIFLK